MHNDGKELAKYLRERAAEVESLKTRTLTHEEWNDMQQLLGVDTMQEMLAQIRRLRDVENATANTRVLLREMLVSHERAAERHMVALRRTLEEITFE